MKKLLLLCALLAASSASAQSAITQPAFNATGAFFALSVPDLDASARWYADKLGLHVIMQPPPFNGVVARVLQGGGLTVELIHNPGAVPLGRAAPAVKNNVLVHGIFKVGLIVDDIDDTLATLRARGIDIAIGPFGAQNGQPANFIIRDNAGNLIQFIGK
jgi:catechol 2,3-dioxygenase-like lactoylglutathione lyase family enzyme